jgi:hypothetical protein
MNQRPLSVREILQWADAYRELTGQWPRVNSGEIPGTHGENWRDVNLALRQGLRTLPKGPSLAQLFAKERGARDPANLPALSIEQILQWADAHHQTTGAWPTAKSGKIPESYGETWATVSDALRAGKRGLPGGSSLARMLSEKRGVRNRSSLEPLTVPSILSWADAHYASGGNWPSSQSGPVKSAPGETWMAIDMALRYGKRGLPGGSSLAFLLADRRGVRNVWTRSSLTTDQILAWADAAHGRTGRWPRATSGPIVEAAGETWLGVDHCLRRGGRGLAGGSSLADLLHQARGVRNHLRVRKLTVGQILIWAEGHRRRHGDWPTHLSGPLVDAPGEAWNNLDAALRQGLRGLPGGSSLAQVLASRRGRRNIQNLPRLSKRKVLTWADEHFARTGNWPDRGSGLIPEAPGESWKIIDEALRKGNRGLPGGSSLGRLLARKRGARPRRYSPTLTEEQILVWADLHYQEAKDWPKHTSGPLANVPGETWMRINRALREGARGLPGGSSLAKLLSEKRGKVYWARRTGNGSAR